MSFIDQIEVRSRNISISSRYTSRKNTFIKPKTGGNVSINISRHRSKTQQSQLKNALGDSLAVNN